MFQAGGAAGGAGQAEVEIPLPPGGHRLVSIRAAGGGAITAFSADDGDCGPRSFTTAGLPSTAGRPRPAGSTIASGWHARFEMRSRAPALAVDIRLGIDSQGRWSGL